MPRPTAVPSSFVDAEPSPRALASMLFSACNISAPLPAPLPATMLTPSPTLACAPLQATFRPSAAPTLTAPFFFFQAADGIRVDLVTGVQTCALPISDDDQTDHDRAAPWRDGRQSELASD